MVTSNSKYTLKALALSIGFFSLVSCKEHSITKGAIADVDNINTFALSTNDFGFEIRNGLTDSIVTSNFGYSYDGSSTAQKAIAIGTYTDPFFGKTTASAHFQLTPYASTFAFPAGAILDSAVLVLPYSTGTMYGTYYGDTLSTISWNVYKNADKLDKSKVYYSTSQISLGTQIGSASFTYQNFKVGSQQIIASTNDTTSNQLRIKLNQSFAQEMFDADTSIYKSTTAFYEYFNGISVVPSSNIQNLLAYFLIPTETLNTDKNSKSDLRIEFHYHTSDSADFSSIILRSSVSAYYSNITHNYTGFPAQQKVNTVSDSVMIQSQPGFKSDITISGLQQIPLSVINKAEIIITAQPTGTAPNLMEYFNAPSLLIPVLVTDEGKEILLYERLDNNGVNNSSGIYMVDPYVTKVTIDGETYSQYKINIPRSVQQAILERKDKITVRLKGSNYTPGMARVLAKGVNDINSNTKLQFNIIYTKR